MPSTSQSQANLMRTAYACKTGKLDPKTLSKSLQEKIKPIMKSMSVDELHKYTKLKSSTKQKKKP